jgi:hypothetical protein
MFVMALKRGVLITILLLALKMGVPVTTLVRGTGCGEDL